MSAFLHHLLPTDDDAADNQDSAINDDARDKAQAAEFRQHATDDDKDTTLILNDNADNDFAQLAALRKLLDKDEGKA